MTAQVNIPKSARDILLAKVGEFVAEATRKRSEGEHEDALSLYQRSAEILQALLSNEKDQTFKQQLETQLKEIENEKTTLSEEQAILLEIPSSEDSRSRRESTSCEVVISIENVSIHKILGLGEGAPEKILIGKGVLRILRCHPPPESPSSQKPKLESRTESELKEEQKAQPQRSGLCMLQLLPTTSDDSQFQFPLTQSIPCLCTAPGYYIFPMTGNLFYGVVFPSEIPQAYVAVFEGVLEGCCNLRKVQVPPGFTAHQPPVEHNDELALTTVSTSTEIIVAPPPVTQVPLAAKALNTLSSGINTGATALVEGIAQGSLFLADKTRTGGDFIRSKITPSPEPAKVPEPVVSTVYVAGKLSPVCVAVSKVLIASVSAVAEEIGKTVAKGIKGKTQGKSSGPSGPTATAAKQVGKTSLQAFVNVWEALEQAGKLLLNETSSVTVDIVDTKYGAQAAEVTKAGLNVAGDVITAAYNFDQLGLKQIATKAAKQAGKHTVKGIFIEDEALALPAPEEKLALPAPEEKLALPAPEEKLALPAPEEKLALPAPEQKLALPAPDEKMTDTPAE